MTYESPSKHLVKSYNNNHLALLRTQFPENRAFPSFVRMSKIFVICNISIKCAIQESVSTNVAVNFHSAANIKTFTQVPLPPPTRTPVSNDVTWKCLTLFICFFTGAQLVPQDNIVHVVELHNSTVSWEWAVCVGYRDGEVVFVCVGRMLLQSLGYCDSHIHSVPETHHCNWRTNYYDRDLWGFHNSVHEGLCMVSHSQSI